MSLGEDIRCPSDFLSRRQVEAITGCHVCWQRNQKRGPAEFVGGITKGYYKGMHLVLCDTHRQEADDDGDGDFPVRGHGLAIVFSVTEWQEWKLRQGDLEKWCSKCPCIGCRPEGETSGKGVSQ